MQTTAIKIAATSGIIVMSLFLNILFVLFHKIMKDLTQYSSVKPKKLNYVGWVEERNSTFAGLCWVSLRSTQSTIILN